MQPVDGNQHTIWQMKGYINSFHMRYRGLISIHRLHRKINFGPLSFLPLVLLALLPEIQLHGSLLAGEWIDCGMGKSRPLFMPPASTAARAAKRTRSTLPCVNCAVPPSVPPSLRVCHKQRCCIARAAAVWLICTSPPAPPLAQSFARRHPFPPTWRRFKFFKSV